MAKRHYESDFSSQSSQSSHKKLNICNNSNESNEVMVTIDHRLQEDFQTNKQFMELNEDPKQMKTIKFIVEEEEISAPKSIIHILKAKRQLVRDAIERDKQMAKQDNTEEASIFQMSGTTAKAFRQLINYITDGRVECNLSTAIELAATALKLKFHPLVASLTERFLCYKKDCLRLEFVEDLYHIGKCGQNTKLEDICIKFMDKNAKELNTHYLKRDIQPMDPQNVLIYTFEKNRYINYIHFLIPKKSNSEDYEFCFCISVSSDRKNWIQVLNNNEIMCKFWNWVYFDEKRVKYIRITENVDQINDSVIRNIEDNDVLCKRANVELEFDRETHYLIPKHDVIKFPIVDTKYFFDKDKFTYCMSHSSEKNKVKEYYYHKIGDNNNLEFYLSQTCLIDRFSIRLWDCDERTYDFKVEIKSENEEEFILIKDGYNPTYLNKSSWQIIDLRSRRPVRWIRITGIRAPDWDPEFAIIDIRCPLLP